MVLHQQAWYNWGILTIQKSDKLMKAWEIYLIASNYNKDNDFYMVSWHENWKHLIENDIFNNSKVKDFEMIAEKIDSERIVEEKEYEIIEIGETTCNADFDCITPSHYMILSHCPYASKCIENKCNVICPEPFKGIKVDLPN